MLDAVVGGEVAIPQGGKRRHHAERGDEALAGDAGGPRPARGDAGRGRGDGGDDHAPVLERQPRRGQAAPGGREHREGLGEAQRPAQERQLSEGAPAKHGLRARGDLDAPVGRSGRRGPARGAVDQQPVPQRHAAEPERRLAPVRAHRSSTATSRKKVAAYSTSEAFTYSSAPCTRGPASSIVMSRWGQNP